MMRFNAMLFNTTEQCTMRCRHCGFADSRRMGIVQAEDLVDWVTQAVAYGIRHVIFSGGEPFLRFELLRQGVEAVSRQGGASGVFTNAFWAGTPETAYSHLQQLPGLTHLHLSCDEYHLEWVPIQNILNTTQAARQLAIPHIIICITYTKDSQVDVIEELLASESEHVQFHCNRLIPSSYVQDLVPEAYQNLRAFAPAHFAGHCFLHTPLVQTTGQVWACHIGGGATHSDLNLAPYNLGSLADESLDQILKRAEGNAVYQYLRVNGPRAVVEAALGSSARQELCDRRFASDCDMCYQTLPRPEVFAEVQRRASEPPARNNVFLQRLLVLGDKV